MFESAPLLGKSFYNDYFVRSTGKASLEEGCEKECEIRSSYCNRYDGHGKGQPCSVGSPATDNATTPAKERADKST